MLGMILNKKYNVNVYYISKLHYIKWIKVKIKTSITIAISSNNLNNTNNLKPGNINFSAHTYIAINTSAEQKATCFTK